MGFERDLSKWVLAFIGAFVLADVLTHGSVAVQLGNILSKIAISWGKLAAGQQVSG